MWSVKDDKYFFGLPVYAKGTKFFSNTCSVSLSTITSSFLLYNYETVFRMFTSSINVQNTMLLQGHGVYRWQ